MIAALPWFSVGAATSYRENPRVSTARATSHGAFTANTTVVATAHAAVLSVANSVVPTMALYGSPPQLPRQFPRTSSHRNCQRHPRRLSRQSSHTLQLPRKSAAISTPISADVKPQQFPRPSVVIFRFKVFATEVHGK